MQGWFCKVATEAPRHTTGFTAHGVEVSIASEPGTQMGVPERSHAGADGAALASSQQRTFWGEQAEFGHLDSSTPAAHCQAPFWQTWKAAG
jgi:hypothetical protein